MATDLTNLLSDYISVNEQPRNAHTQYTRFPGANGVTAMDLGAGAKIIIVTGSLYATGANYDAARDNLLDDIADLEEAQHDDPASYSYRGRTYDNTKVGRLTLRPDGTGKTIFKVSDTKVKCNFICELIKLS